MLRYSILPGARVIHCVSSIQDNFLRILRRKLDSEIFQMFFEDQFELFCGENANLLFVTAKSAFVLDWYRRKFQSLFQEIAQELIPAFSGTVCVASHEELKRDSRPNSGEDFRKTSPSSADFRTNRERLAHRKQNSQEILASVRRMNIPGVLDVLAGPSNVKSFGSEEIRAKQAPFWTDDRSEMTTDATRGAIPVQRSEKSARRVVSNTQNSSLVSGTDPSMDGFLAQMDEMFRERKISRLFAPEIAPIVPAAPIAEIAEAPEELEAFDTPEARGTFDAPEILDASEALEAFDSLEAVDAPEAGTLGASQDSVLGNNGRAPEVRVLENRDIRSEIPSSDLRKALEEPTSSDRLAVGSVTVHEEFSGSSKLQRLIASVLKNSTDVASDASRENASSRGFSEDEESRRNEPQPLSRSAGFSSGTFETFVVGYSNRVAYSTAHGIHLNMGLMSPVLFTGGTGVGKTHLLDAIYRNAVKCGFSTVHKTCEEFINDFVASLREQRKKAEFLETYRQCDLLILDNLQFLLGKQGTLTELQNIFNYRIRHGKQIVLASDRPLEKMEELGPELLSKLRGGCVCRLNEPSFDVRLGILAQESKARKLPLSDEQCQKLANQYVGDVRAILGALNTLEMMTRAQFGIPGRKSYVPSREQNRVVQQLVDDMVNQPGKSVSMDDIKRFVAVQFGIDTVLLSSGQRIRKVSQPRMLAMWLARKFTRKSLAEIGSSFGCASHSTVIAAQKKVEEWRTRDFRIQTVESVRSVNELLHQLETQLQRSL